MNNALSELFEEKVKENKEQKERALAEILQSIALLGLSRSDFFDKAAFYGGTALRILYNLDRFSEDLDFSLLTPDPGFSLQNYFNFIATEMKSFGLQSEISQKAKSIASSTESAFIKATTVTQILTITSNPAAIVGIHPAAITKVKFEIDIDPPPGAVTIVGYADDPVPFSMRSYNLPSLFAGKMHAILARSWGNRIKGRDWYDFAFYVRNDVPLQLSHLEARLRQTGHYADAVALTQGRFMDMLNARISAIDFEAAKKDVERFVARPQDLAVWSADYFSHLAARLKFV